MSTTVGTTPQGAVQSLGVPDQMDYPRLVYVAPYFRQVPLAELIEPSVQESVEALLPSLVPPYVQNAADAAVQQLAVLLTGSTMSGPLMLAPLMPTADSMAATKAYVDAMVATAGVPEVPPVPSGQIWARQTGQWVPISEQEGTFLPLAGGTMQGQINMSGYAINNLAALPNMPNGAAPASWVLQQIASVSLYQGTWNMDTYTPDLTNPNTHVNGYTWIAITASTSGVVIGPAIPGLQGQTVFNGDTIIWSNIQGQFNRIHSGGLSLAEAQALFLPFTGGTMTGPLLAFENPTEAMEVATMGWVQSLIPTGGIIPAPPNDGQVYGRNGLTASWLPVLPLAGGVMTGAIMLAGNATNALSPVPLQQMNSTLSASYLALAGGTMTGPMVLSGNASANLNPVPLQQVNSMLAGFLPISGGTLTGPLTLSGNAAAAMQAVPLQQLQTYLPLAGGNLTGRLGVGYGTMPTTGAVGVYAQWLTLAPPSGTPNTVTGNIGFNAYYDTTLATAARATAGIAATMGIVSGSNVFQLNVAPTGAAGSSASNAAGVWQASPTGLFTHLGPVFFQQGAQSIGTPASGSFITINGATTQGGAGTASLIISGGGRGSYAMELYNGAAEILTVAGDGSMWIAGTLTQASDATNKTDITPITQGISLIRQLIPKAFAWLSSPNEIHWGFIAQDVQPVVPPAVVTQTNENPTTGATTTSLSLDTTALLAAVVYALKQLDQRCVALEAAASITPPAAELA